MFCMRTRLLTATAVARSVTAISVFAQNILELNAITTAGAHYFRGRVQTAGIHTSTSYDVFVDHENEITSANGVTYNADKNASKCCINDISSHAQVGYCINATASFAESTSDKIKHSNLTVKISSGKEVDYTASLSNIGAVENYTVPPKILLKKTASYLSSIDNILEITSFATGYDLNKTGTSYIKLCIVKSLTRNPVFISISYIKTSYKVSQNDESFQDHRTKTDLKAGIAC